MRPVARTIRVVVRGTDALRAGALASALAEAGHALVAEAPEVIILDHGAALDESEAARTVAIGGTALRAAAQLSGDASIAQIDAAIRAVAVGLVVRLPGERGPGFDAAVDAAHAVLLTPREIEVLAAIAEGLGNKEIARRLDISLHTVKFHIESMFRKLGARSRAEAVTKGWDILRGAIEL
jgi:DNA-binding NarL/FixJ family response regulator